MKALKAFVLLSVVLFSMFAAALAASARVNSVEEKEIVVYAISPIDDSGTNPRYTLLGFHWYSAINYYVNPKNNYRFSTTTVVNTITASANAWDSQTNYQVFNYKGTTTRTAGRRDGYNVVSWGLYYSRNVIAVTTIWYSGSQIVETDCRMNTAFKWSLKGEAGKMDVQNIMTHEFGHWCGLADLYNDVDYWLTMYGYAGYGETYKRDLGLGDILGLKAVYGP